MKKILFNICFIMFLFGSLLGQSQLDYQIKSAKLSNVSLTEGFWQKRYEANRNVTLTHIFEQLEKTGRIDNIRFAAGIKEGQYCTTYPFDDTDIYKTIEAASYLLMNEKNTQLESKLDSLINLLQKVQAEDGYLYSPRNAPSEKIKKSIGPERFSNLQWSHELYNAGHLYEAAVAHFQATGKKNLLNIALKNADYILNTFGPNGLQLPPGHQEIEIGLVKIYELTGNKKYLDQAKYFLDIRGKGKELTNRESWNEYAQDHLPVIEQTEAVGHAVRAAYMFSAMTDIAEYTGDIEYQNAINKLWTNIINQKLYITGGIGSTGSGEALGAGYDLPNASAYNETCSSIANMMWNYRMFKMYGDGKYIDVIERTLYNAFLSGIGMEGNNFFYPNPLESYGTHTRSPWFTCACCPPNIARFIASLPSKVYAMGNEGIFVNLYTANKAKVEFAGNEIELEQVTNYPWNGKIKLFVRPQKVDNKFKLFLRVPGWSREKPIDGDLYCFLEKAALPTLSINGKLQKIKIEKGYISISKKWKAGDAIELNLPMEIRHVIANENVKEDKGKAALQRGPLVYALEWPENGQDIVDNILIPDASDLTYTYDSTLLNGVNVIKGQAQSYHYGEDGDIINEDMNFTAIPYYAWAHRGTGEMCVWLPRDEKYIKPRNGPTLTSQSKISVSSGRRAGSINDQIEPDSSSDQETPYYYWWPNKGTEEWVQVDFPEIQQVSKVAIYWFDDTGTGECRIPASWKVMYKVEDQWQYVYPTEEYTTLKDGFSEVVFETVRSAALKIIIQSQEDFAGGIYEIKIR